MGVSLKSTKKEIFEAYQEALKSSVKHEDNVTELRAKKETDRAIEVAATITHTDVTESIGNLKGVLTHVENKIKQKKDTYDEICKAVEAKKLELKEATDIEVAYDTLFVLKEQARVHKEEIDLEFKVKREQLLADFQRQRDENKTAMESFVLSNARKTEELEYNYKRRERELEDVISDLHKKIDSAKDNLEKLENVDSIIEKEAAIQAQKIVDENTKDVDRHMLVAARKHENDLLSLQKDVEMFTQANQLLREENDQLKAEIRAYREQIYKLSETGLNSKSAVVNVSKANA